MKNKEQLTNISAHLQKCLNIYSNTKPVLTPHFLPCLGEVGVVGIGVDLVDISIFKYLVTSGGSAFLNIVWTAVEQKDASGVLERLAARWAAKEAVMKALGSGLGDVDPLDIEIALGIDGAPEVQLCGSASDVAKKCDVGLVHISMSHEYDVAIAFAVALRIPSG